MKRALSLGLILVFILPLAGCPKGDRKTEAMRYIADGTAALIAWSDAVERLNAFGDLDNNGYKAQLELNEKFRVALGLLRENVHKGLTGADTITKIQSLIVEVESAQELGLLGIKNPDAQARFREIAAFAKLSLQTVKNILQALQPPPPPNPVKVESVLRGSRQSATQTEKWTAFVLIGQNFAFAVIQNHRLDESGAFGAASNFDGTLANQNKTRLAAL